MQLAGLEQSISKAIPHIFRRPLLSVRKSDSMLQVATFLAIGPEIYVDGLVVIDDDQRPLGTIGGQHLMQHILYHEDKWLEYDASSIMSSFASTIESSAQLSSALEIFAKTKFAFCPISINGKVLTVLSLRDTLKLVAMSGLNKKARDLASQLISIDSDASIGTAIETMLNNSIRNVAIREDIDKNVITILNDRKILEFLLSYEGRRVMESRGINGLFDTRASVIYVPPAVQVSGDTPATSAAELFSVKVPALTIKDEGESIVTPWDIVMKGFRNWAFS